MGRTRWPISTGTGGRIRRNVQTLGIAVHVTAEPSATEFGELIRSCQGTIRGKALALAVAADRTLHVETEIVPRLASGAVVMTDRYVQSSLVLQRPDGLSADDIWSYNLHVLPPLVSFCLSDDPAVIRRRLRDRPHLDRLEEQHSPELQLALYREAMDFLRGKGWLQFCIDCHERTPEAIGSEIVRRVDEVSQ